MRMADILFTQGFGTRRICAGLIQHGTVTAAGRVVDDPHEDVATEDLTFTVQGQSWPFHARLLVMLNKPAGYECSRVPKHHPSVLSLLPEPLRNRGAQPVGRLDEDTTGLLLLTDDGPLIHRLTHPKRHLDKVYEVQTRHALDDAQVAAMLAGVTLLDDPRPAVARAAAIVCPHHLRLTLTEGRYHQVKRMLAAVGNRVDGLHRSAFGALALPADVPPGHWRWLSAETVF